MTASLETFGAGVRGDLLAETICEPLAIGDVEVLAPVRTGQVEQAAEGSRGVGVLVGEGEALALTLLHDLARLPVVLVLLRDRA